MAQGCEAGRPRQPAEGGLSAWGALGGRRATSSRSSLPVGRGAWGCPWCRSRSGIAGWSAVEAAAAWEGAPAQERHRSRPEAECSFLRKPRNHCVGGGCDRTENGHTRASVLLPGRCAPWAPELWFITLSEGLIQSSDSGSLHCLNYEFCWDMLTKTCSQVVQSLERKTIFVSREIPTEDAR